MVDLKILEVHGCSAGKWKTLFENFYETPNSNTVTGLNPGNMYAAPTDQQGRLQRLVSRIKTRITSGRDYNIAHFRNWYALDLIWDEPFRQVNPQLIMEMADKHPTGSDAQLEAFKMLGLHSTNWLIETEEKDSKTGKPVKKLNIPSFFQLSIPLVRSYITTRRAAIVNERNEKVFYDFEPVVNTTEGRIKCHALSARANAVAQQYDHLGALNQSTFSMLLYGWCLAFTREEWHTTKQTRTNSAGLEEDYIVSEGLRYYHPHPSRCYWDMSYPVGSLNTNTGSKWAGYWGVIRYGEILNNKSFFNTGKVTLGDVGWWQQPSTAAFFNTIYQSCAMAIPIIPTELADRETFLKNNPYYSASMQDRSVVLYEHREIVIPEDDGLGDYKHPIWARFVVAGDGTIIYAAPVPYTPVTVVKDNGDEKRREDASLALTLSPFAGMISNLVTQHILTVKQNLANLTLIDSDMMNQLGPDKKGTPVFDQIANLGESMYRRLNLFSFSGSKMKKTGVTVPQAIYSHRFPYTDTNAIMATIRMIIDLLERVMQFSSQELAQAASHEQTRAEINSIAGAKSSILQYTSIPVDAQLKAQAIQLYEALMAYGDDEFFVELPNDPPISLELLKQWGFDHVETITSPRPAHIVKTDKERSKMALMQFAWIPTEDQRSTDSEMAKAMVQFLQILQGPLAQYIGPAQMVDIANGIARLANLPLDKPLRNAAGDQVTDELKTMINGILAQVSKMQKDGMVPVLQELGLLHRQVMLLSQRAKVPMVEQQPSAPDAQIAPPAGPPVQPAGQMLPAPQGMPMVA